MTALVFCCRLFLAVALFAAGIAKARTPRQVNVSAVARYGVPGPLAGILGTVLPEYELLVALLLIIGFAPIYVTGSVCAFFLSVTFVVAWNVKRGRRFACGCGFSHETAVGWGLAARAAGFAAFAAIVAVSPPAMSIWHPGSRAATVSATSVIPVFLSGTLLLAAARLVSMARVLAKADGLPGLRTSLSIRAFGGRS